LLAHDRWFSPGTPASSTNKIGRHDTAEIVLKVALKHQKIKNIKIKNCPTPITRRNINVGNFEDTKGVTLIP